MAKEKKVKNPAGISFKDSIKTKLITVMLLVAAIPLISFKLSVVSVQPRLLCYNN